MKTYEDLAIHENFFSRYPIEKEAEIYEAVATGNMYGVMEYCNSNKFTDSEGIGELSPNRVTNFRYHFVIGTSMIARYCVMHGLEQDVSYTMSDYYICKMDKINTVEEISRIYKAMCIDYCEAMISLKKRSLVSRSILQVLDYISTNIYTSIHVSDIAKYVDLSESYLSRLFTKEMGISIHEYINIAKVEKARNLLCYSDFSFIDISNYLGFSSQSHFITVFKKYEGMTPKKYRDTHFRPTWSIKPASQEKGI